MSLDHTAILGDTIDLVAAEKAGIVKSAVPVIVAPQHPDALRVIESRAAEQDAVMHQVGVDLRVESGQHSLEGQAFTVATQRGSESRIRTLHIT